MSILFLFKVSHEGGLYEKGDICDPALTGKIFYRYVAHQYLFTGFWEANAATVCVSVQFYP